MDKQITISVSDLSKNFKQYKKRPGLSGSIRSVVKRDFFEVEAVKDISFEIDQGEFVGFIGPNGAGKTTTLKCLTGLLYPTSGMVNVLGYTPWERKAPFLRQISLVMGQKNQLWWDLPAMDSFLLIKEIYEIPDELFESRLANLVDLLELGELLDIPVRKLSLGQRMKCELCVALLHDPKVLFLDEPTIGLDVVMQKKLRNFFKQYNEQFKTTVMLTSHYMEDVKELAKRVIIINEGVIVYDGNLQELTRKYVFDKYVSVVLRKTVTKSDAAKFGEIIEYDGVNITYSIPRADVPSVSASILQKLPVEDLDIREPALDEVIREVFKNGTQPRP